jgi:hypothetical protein
MYIYIYTHILHVFLKLIYIDGTTKHLPIFIHIYYYKHTSLKYLLKWVWAKKAIFSSKLSKRVNTSHFRNFRSTSTASVRRRSVLAQVVRKADVGLSALERKVTGQVEEPLGRGCFWDGKTLLPLGL